MLGVWCGGLLRRFLKAVCGVYSSVDKKCRSKKGMIDAVRRQGGAKIYLKLLNWYLKIYESNHLFIISTRL